MKNMKLPVSVLVRKQTKEFTKLIHNGKGHINVEIRWDDECGNSHNSFAITGAVYSHPTSENNRYCDTCGCIHEEIEKYFPEFKHLIKWHLASSDNPMYYIENTTYFARDRTHEGVEIGGAVAFDTKLKFEQIPFTFKEQSKGFWEFLESVGDFKNIEVEDIKYDGQDKYNFSDHYSFTGFIKENEAGKWYRAPFKDKERAKEFLEALQSYKYSFVETPIKWCEPVEPNLKNARACAIWEDATLEQLRDREALLNRLPSLMKKFKKDIEKLGFIY